MDAGREKRQGDREGGSVEQWKGGEGGREQGAGERKGACVCVCVCVCVCSHEQKGETRIKEAGRRREQAEEERKVCSDDGEARRKERQSERTAARDEGEGKDFGDVKRWFERGRDAPEEGDLEGWDVGIRPSWRNHVRYEHRTVLGERAKEHWASPNIIGIKTPWSKPLVVVKSN
eukprot:2581231-Rhodomonas_salina.1